MTLSAVASMIYVLQGLEEVQDGEAGASKDGPPLGSAPFPL